MALLEVDHLTIGYQTQRGLLKAVEGVSFSLDQGKTLGLVGESGCGKTTLGMALMGLLPSNGSILQGRIVFNGEDLLKYTEDQMRNIRWQEMAMIFQGAMNALNPVHRIDDQIAEAILAHAPDLAGETAKRQVEDLFRLVGIPPERHRDFPHQYSGGMKQRAVIAMALACRPKFIIADEPTTALDVIVQGQILQEIKALQNTFSISILLISHDISIVGEMCHNIGIMYAGQLVEYGTTEGLFTHPLHPYTKALLGSIPTLDGDRVGLTPISGEPPNLVIPPPGCRFHARCAIGESACTLSDPQWVEVFRGHRARCFNPAQKSWSWDPGQRSSALPLEQQTDNK